VSNRSVFIDVSRTMNQCLSTREPVTVAILYWSSMNQIYITIYKPWRWWGGRCSHKSGKFKLSRRLLKIWFFPGVIRSIAVKSHTVQECFCFKVVNWQFLSRKKSHVRNHRTPLLFCVLILLHFDRIFLRSKIHFRSDQISRKYSYLGFAIIFKTYIDSYELYDVFHYKT